MTVKPLCIIVGAGEGLGMSLAQYFAHRNYQVIGINRSQVSLDDSSIIMQQVDIANQQLADTTLTKLIDEYGVPDVLIHNTAQLSIKPFEDTRIDEFESAWQAMVLSAFNAMKIIVPHMAQQARGTVIVSGATASLKAGANFSAFASAKFALRGLVQSVAREYQKQGVHIAHIILDGILDTQASRALHSLEPADMMSTQEVAEAYMQVVEQKPSAWTHELDLRPKNETF